MATPRKTAAKVANPRKQAARAQPEPESTAEVTVAGRRRVSGLATTAPTRTATGGKTTRTATPPRGRTTAKAAKAVAVIEPTEILAAPEPAPADNDEAAAGGVVEETPIVWHGRSIRVRLPTIEQLTMYDRLSKKFAKLAEEGAKPGAAPMSMQDAVHNYDRAVKLITSVIVDRADIEFLEDLLLEREVDLAEAGTLLKQAFDRLGEANDEAKNRADRRAARGRARLVD